MHEYFAAIPPATVTQIFKRNEVEPDIFAGMLEAFAQHGSEEPKVTGQFFLALTSAPGFDMLSMFAEDQDRANIKAILDVLMAADKPLGAQFKKAYVQ
jgi:hypothetical protein